MGLSKVKNIGENAVDFDWGDNHFHLEPGETSLPIAESTATKWRLRCPDVEILPSEDFTVVQKQEDPISDNAINFDLSIEEKETRTEDRNRVGAGPRRKKKD